MRIFVSSTFEDLREYRAAAIRVLRQLGHEVLAMEDMVAGSATPLTKVIEMVDRCEAYVGVFAWRYGYVPKASDPPARKRVAAVPPAVKDAQYGQTSITHYEYLRARQREVPILAFLLDERTPWPPALVDGHDFGAGAPLNAERIRALRAELQEEKVVAWFSTPADLEARVAAAVTMAGLSRQIDLKEAVSLGRNAGTAAVTDSGGRSVVDAVGQADAEQRVFKIDIGDEWWSTRLYLIAALGQRLTQVRRILIVQSKPGPVEAERRPEFVGLVSTATVMAALRPLHPQIGTFERWLAAPHSAWPDEPRPAADHLLKAGWAPAFGGRQTTREKAQAAEERAKVLVSAQRLRRWFGEAMLPEAVQIADLNRASVVDLIRLVDYPGEYVPVCTHRAVAGQTEPALVIDVVEKASLNRRLAHSYLLELKERARIV